MDPAWSGRGGGGALLALGAKLSRVRAPPAHQFAWLLQSLAWLLYLNCNYCSQFAYHHVITQITVSHSVCFNMKNSTPPALPLARARGCDPPPTPPSKSIPGMSWLPEKNISRTWKFLVKAPTRTKISRFVNKMCSHCLFGCSQLLTSLEQVVIIM